MTETPTDQPSKVSTEEEVRPPDKAVVTDDRDFFGVPSPADADKEKPAASGDTKPADPTTKPSAGSDDKEKKPKSSGRDRPAERKIKKLMTQVSDLEGGRLQDQSVIDGLQTQIDALKAKTPETPEPQLKDFDSPAEYAKAFGKWDAAQKPTKPTDADAGKPPAGTRDPTKHATHEPTGQSAPDEEIVDFHKRGKSKLGDEFIEALEKSGTAVDSDMGEFLIDSEFGAEIYIHLANNQDDAKKIFDSGAIRKVKALEALEVKAKAGTLDIDSMQDAITVVDNDDDQTGGKKPPAGDAVQTKAKDPPSSTREPGSAEIKADPENEDMDTYAKRRNKEELAKRGIYQ